MVTVVALCGALSDERSGLLFKNHVAEVSLYNINTFHTSQETHYSTALGSK
jgi:hypothetical protein